MFLGLHQSRWFLVLPVLTCAACGATLHDQSAGGSPSRRNVAQAQAARAATPPAAVETPAPVDPVVTLIASSEQHFKAGQKELDLGHFEGARAEFNRAIDVLLESPYGGRTEPRIREHFDRLVDRISAYEVHALVEGDGFTEKSYEPASIDQLLAMSTTFAPTPLSLQDQVKSDLRSGVHDIPIPLNQRVLSYISLFQGRLHDFIEDGMRRGSQYLPMIQGVFRSEGLPLDLAYVPLIESAFKPNALSHAKAKGVWQFMHGTAVENGLRHDWYIDERSDPEKATEAAAKYLLTLNKLFDGDWHLALASYNGGPGRIQRAIKRVGVDDFWKLADKPKLLPRETREYVPMILAAIIIARNPAEYGFDFEPEHPPAYETVTLAHPVDLRRIAEWTDTTIDDIQALNPELRRWTTPVRDDEYELRVPAGTGERVKARLAEASSADLASLKWYTVKRGDTLPGVARKLHVGRTDLAEANYLPVRTRVKVGQKLMVPYEATALMAARADRPTPVAEARRTVADTGLTARAAATSDRVRLTYTVRHGDTLSSIAQLYRTTVAAIRTWNRMPDARIAAGDRLTIFAAKHGND